MARFVMFFTVQFIQKKKQMMRTLSMIRELPS